MSAKEMVLGGPSHSDRLRVGSDYVGKTFGQRTGALCHMKATDLGEERTRD